MTIFDAAERAHKGTSDFYAQREVEHDERGHIRTQFDRLIDALLQAQTWARHAAQGRPWKVVWLVAEPGSYDGGVGFYMCLDAYAQTEDGIDELRFWFHALASDEELTEHGLRRGDKPETESDEPVVLRWRTSRNGECESQCGSFVLRQGEAKGSGWAIYRKQAQERTLREAKSAAGTLAIADLPELPPGYTLEYDSILHEHVAVHEHMPDLRHDSFCIREDAVESAWQHFREQSPEWYAVLAPLRRGQA